jgi:hypothetical protein
VIQLIQKFCDILEGAGLKDRINNEAKVSPCEVNLSDATVDLVKEFVKLSEYVS